MPNSKNSHIKVPGSLIGIDGNAFAILGYFRSQAMKEGVCYEAIMEIIEHAQSRDYNHLIATINSHLK